jgi:hypothetical protein
MRMESEPASRYNDLSWGPRRDITTRHSAAQPPVGAAGEGNGVVDRVIE